MIVVVLLLLPLPLVGAGGRGILLRLGVDGLLLLVRSGGAPVLMGRFFFLFCFSLLVGDVLFFSLSLFMVVELPLLLLCLVGGCLPLVGGGGVLLLVGLVASFSLFVAVLAHFFLLVVVALFPSCCSSPSSLL